MCAQRKLLPVFTTMPANEKARLMTFAKTVGRPLSWIIRDALTNYLDAVGKDAGKLAQLQAPLLSAPEIGKAYAVKMGRPRKGTKKRANVR